MAYIAPRGTVDILPGKSEQWIKLEQLLRTISANYNVKEMRRQTRRKYLQKTYLITNYSSKNIWNKNNLIKKWAKDLNRYLTKEYRKLASKYIWKDAQHIIREIHIKTRYYYTPIKMCNSQIVPKLWKKNFHSLQW